MLRLTSIALILTLMLPSAVVQVIPSASMSTGLVLAAFAWLTIFLARNTPAYTLRRTDGQFVAWSLAAIVFLSLHLVASSLQTVGQNLGRFVGSCVLFLLVNAGAHFASRRLLSVPGTSLVRGSNDVLLCLAAVALAAAAGVPELGPPVHSHPIVVFAEPSHFALATLPILLFRTAISRRPTQVLLIGAALFVALSLQSLTLVAGILFVASLLLRQALLLFLVVPLGALALLLDLTYYSERLAFSSDSNNVSTLVFLQGWQNAILNFNETHGIGVGFQQFGIAGSLGDIGDRIAMLLAGDSINLLDGGTTAAKLIGEFGVFGILFLAVFVAIAVRSILFLRRSQVLPPARRDIHGIFFCSMIATYAIELFVRGVGYFSAGGFLALVSVISLAKAGWPSRTHKKRIHLQEPSLLHVPQTGHQ